MGTALPSTVLDFATHRTPERIAEARAIEQIRRDCRAAGLSPQQTQAALARARTSLRAGQPPGPAMSAVTERAHVLGVPSPTLLSGLQAALRALVDGRSPALAYQEGVRALKAHSPARADDGGAA